jgi:outer membrane protein assembly factor BamA
MLKLLGIALFFCCSNIFCATNEADTILTKNSFYVLPIASYQQETSLSAGLAGAYYFKSEDLSKISSIAGTAAYTLENQFVFNLTPKLYLGKNNFYLYSNISARNYPDYYYGIGTIQNSKRVPFTARNSALLLQPQYIISKSFFIGTIISFESEHLLSDLSSASIGKDQNIFFRPEDWSPYHQFTLGLITAYDSRDNQFYPNHGNFAKTTLSLSKAGWGSTYSIQELTLDFRNYLPLTGQHLLATQFYFDGLSGLKIPYGQLPSTGGSDLLRGFRQGQYRDNSLITLQTEYRAPLYKRLKGAAFLAVGDVFNSTDFKIYKLKAAYGAGFRYQLNDARVHLRFDIAKNNYGDNLQFYLTASEAF